FRAHTSRHGAGPFPTEDYALTRLIPEMHNGTNLWQQHFRLGWFDMVMARYALDVVGNQVDYLAVSNLDRFATLPTWQVANEYQVEAAQLDPNRFESNANRIQSITV